MEEANIKLTALANSVRELSGTTSIKGIVEMTEDVTAANTEIAEQADLLTQIASALEGKAAGSGGGSVETCTGTAKSYEIPPTNSVWFINSNMQPESCNLGSKVATTFTAVKGTFVFIYGSTASPANRTLEGVTLLYSNGYSIVVSIDSDNFKIIT